MVVKTPTFSEAARVRQAGSAKVRETMYSGRRETLTDNERKNAGRKVVCDRLGVAYYDFNPTDGNFRQDVLAGLRGNPKSIPSKHLYDPHGSELFDRICETDEYYITRTEIAIMRDHIDEIVSRLGEGCVLIEPGSGSSVKTRILLEHFPGLAAYLPVDISKRHLLHAAANLIESFPGLTILPIWADFTEEFTLPMMEGAGQRVVYFPGSTIGNFTPEAASRLLRQIARLCGKNGALLIGVDLKKDRDTLEAAYNDRQGVTRSFTLNLLERINRELGTDFQVDRFEHRAVYEEIPGRISTSIESLRDQTVRWKDERFFFGQGELMQTEYSYKYSLEQWKRFSAAAGFEVKAVWTDPNHLFSVQYMTVR